MEMVLLTALGVGGATIVGAVIGFFVRDVVVEIPKTRADIDQRVVELTRRIQQQHQRHTDTNRGVEGGRRGRKARDDPLLVHNRQTGSQRTGQQDDQPTEAREAVLHASVLPTAKLQ